MPTEPDRKVRERRPVLASRADAWAPAANEQPKRTKIMVEFDIKQLDITKQNVVVEEVLDGHRQSAAPLHSKTPYAINAYFVRISAA